MHAMKSTKVNRSAQPSASRAQRAVVTRALAVEAPAKALAASDRVQLGDSDLSVSSTLLPARFSRQVASD